MTLKLVDFITDTGEYLRAFPVRLQHRRLFLWSMSGGTTTLGPLHSTLCSGLVSCSRTASYPWWSSNSAVQLYWCIRFLVWDLRHAVLLPRCWLRVSTSPLVCCQYYPWSNLIQGFFDTQMSSQRASIKLSEYFLHFSGRSILGCRGPSISWPPVALQHIISHCQWIPLGPVNLVDGSAVSNVLPGMLSSLHFLQNWPHDIVILLEMA
jgi:hypothetical protein